MENDESTLIDFEELVERINNLEMVVASLLSPDLMYKRPGSEEHEKLTATLDYLHNKLKELEDKCIQ